MQGQREQKSGAGRPANSDTHTHTNFITSEVANDNSSYFGNCYQPGFLAPWLQEFRVGFRSFAWGPRGTLHPKNNEIAL